MSPRFLGRFTLPLLFLALAPLPARAICPPAPVYCEGWARDSSRREVSLTRAALCKNGMCPAVCSTAPIVALPSVRIGQLDHVVLGFAVADACIPECPGTTVEPCHNLGVSYRNLVASGSEAVVGTYDCDPTDPGTVVSTGATFSATYQTGGTANVTVSNIVYGMGSGADDCGAAPTALDLTASGPGMAIQSHFAFAWAGDQVVAYSETRTYTGAVPTFTVHISVWNINYAAGTFDVSVPDAPTPTLRATWGQLKILYR